MQLTRSHLIIIGSVVFVVLLVIGIFTGILPGTRTFQPKAPEVSLTIWGIDDREFLNENLTNYEALRTNVRVKYTELDPATYEQTVINALAAKSGPDIIMFHNSWLVKHYDKIVTLNEELLTKKSFQEMFPEVVEQDFLPSDKIYALPLYIDTLALFYNRDTFDKKGIAIPPKDWLDFQNLIPKLNEKDKYGNLTKLAAAIGGSEDNIDKASELLMLLMLQSGAKMTNEDFSQASFSQNVEGGYPGMDALSFYTKFSNPKDDIYYTWNEKINNSLDSFANGNVAMIFNYASVADKIKSKNPFLSFKASEMPQPTGGSKSVNYPDYWGLSVTNNSKNPDWAWDLILYLTANETAAEKYLLASNKPPAMRLLIQKYLNHPTLGVFAKQALSARSWPQVDKNKTAAIFSQMIKAVVSGQLSQRDALSQAEREVTELMTLRK